MKIAIDPGHGMSNGIPGVFDRGASGNGHREADIALRWAQELAEILPGYGIECWLTRKGNADPAPVGKRAARAQAEGCTHYLSVHCNSSKASATGTETFYRGASGKAFARIVQQAALDSLGLRDRGIKHESASARKRLAVLAFPRSSLLELGFISHPGDVRAMTLGANIGMFAHRLGAALTGRPADAPPIRSAAMPALVNGHECPEWQVCNGEAWINLGQAARKHGWGKGWHGAPIFNIPEKGETA